MRRSLVLVLAACLIACFATPFLAGWDSVAQAQENNNDKALTRRTDAEKKRDAEIDRQYRAVVGRGEQGAAAKSDPWGNVRSQPAQTGKK